MIQFHDGWEDDDDDDQGEPEGGDDDDLDACPRCGRLIFDDSVRCPRCGTYVTREEPGSKPWWVVLGVLVCLALVVYWIFDV